MSGRAAFLLASCAVFFAATAAASDVGKLPLPEWVKEIPVEEFSSDRTGEFQLGVAYLLRDHQVRKTSDGYDYAMRLAYEVIDRSGLEGAARISHDFDPEEETSAFNFVRVLRDGEVIDRLTDAEILSLRQEKRLASGIIDGRITAVIQLDDIRVGDVIDYSYSGHVASKLWPEHYFATVLVEWPMPIAQLHYSLTVPEDLAVNFRSIATDLEPQVSVSDGRKTLELHVIDPDPVRMELDVPADWTTHGYIEFTTMESWSDVVDWALPLFSVDETLPAEFAEKLDGIAYTHPLPHDRAAHALRLVQEDIRYLGMETGLGSHVPRSPSFTLERGYGDCKDKSVLLAAALKYLGIDAVPALASTTNGEILPDVPPSIGGFNHAIVEFEVDGRQFHVDPTLSHQGGKGETLSPLGYGYVLPVRPGQAELVELDLPFPERPMFEVAETLEVPESGDIGLNITADYTFRSTLADVSRLSLSAAGKESFSRSFLDSYAAKYDGVAEGRPMTITDDRDANELVFRVAYEIDTPTFRASGYDRDLPIFGSAVQGAIPREIEASRTAPLALPFGSSTRHTIRVVTPGRILTASGEQADTVGGVTFSRAYRSDGAATEIEFRLDIKAEAVGPMAFKALTDFADKIAKDTELFVYLNKASPTLARKLGLQEPLDRETELAAAQVEDQVENGEYVKALAGLNRLLDTQVEPSSVRGYLLLQKALVLVQLGRDKAALGPFEEAFALFEPLTTEGYFRYLDALERQAQDTRAAEVIVRLLEQHPTAADEFSLDWVSTLLRYFRQTGKQDELEAVLVALARAAHKTQPADMDKFRWVFVEAVEVLSARGEAREARDYLGYIKDPEVFARLLASKDSKSLWRDIEKQAGSDLSKAIEDYVAYSKQVLSTDPEDFDKKRTYLNALRLAGRLEEAIEFAAPIAEDWALIEAVGKDAYWFVDNYAATLSDAGQPERAQKTMTRLLTLGVPENGELIAMAINRALALLHWGQFEAALEALEEIDDVYDSLSSDYGKMFIYDVRACSLHQLERTDEALAIVRDRITPIADENPVAHTKTMLCIGDMEKASSIIIDRLNDDLEKDAAILSFGKDSLPGPRPPFLAELYNRAEQVRSRPEVRKAFDKVGRVITMKGSSRYLGSF